MAALMRVRASAEPPSTASGQFTWKETQGSGRLAASPQPGSVRSKRRVSKRSGAGRGPPRGGRRRPEPAEGTQLPSTSVTA